MSTEFKHKVLCTYLMDRGDLIPFNTIIVTDVQHRAKDEPLFCPNVVAGFELIHT